MGTRDAFAFSPSPFFQHAEGSDEKGRMKHALEHLTVKVKMPIPLVINGEDLRPGRTVTVRTPYRHELTLGTVEQASSTEMTHALDTAARMHPAWSAMPGHQRAAVFARTADLLRDSWRATVGAATMVSLGKTVMEAEQDACSGLMDVLRWAAQQAASVDGDSPVSVGPQQHTHGYGPGHGVVLALTPASSLARAAALVVNPAAAGNTVVWKPSSKASYLGHFLMRVMREAGLPDGVINYVPGPQAELLFTAVKHPSLVGISFGGRRESLAQVQRAVASALPAGQAFPRVHAEIGGGNAMLATGDADVSILAAACVRGAFGDAGQRGTSISRLYLPQSLHDLWRPTVMRLLRELKTGSVEDFTTSQGPVLNEAQHQRLKVLLDEARGAPGHKVIFGGKADATRGYVVDPTVVLVPDASSPVFARDPLGPVLSVMVYPDASLPDVLRQLKSNSGAVLSVVARDRLAVNHVVRAVGGAFGTVITNDVPSSAAGQPWWPGAPGSSGGVTAWMNPVASAETFDPPLHFATPGMLKP
jgi:1-pyrroline-5-carboxylate dehydrogenase